MGRWPWARKQEADRLLRLSVFDLRRWGYLGQSKSGWLSWTDAWSDQKSIVGVSSSAEGWVRLTYTQTNTETGEKRDFDYKIRLTPTPCYFGGERYWFICPSAYCGRRVGVLYKGGNYFACRHCYDLAYRSQRRSRSSKLYALGRILDLETRIEWLEERRKRRYYRGRPTRKQRRIDDLYERTRLYYPFILKAGSSPQETKR